VPDGSRDGEDGPVTRDLAARAADHAGIERLSDELLPALIAKLGTTRLGELEVREGDWRVRLRRPAPEAADAARRSGMERPSRSQPGHEGHGHPPAALEAHGRRATTTPASGGNGSAPALAAVGPGRGDSRANGHGAHGGAAGHGGDHASPGGSRAGDPADALATSPAVGVFVPSPNLTSGMRVRAGDRLGIVDMLGVPQEVLAPVDGIVGEVLVEGGTAVEYGQELIRVELAAGTEAR
jgi:biotin carboxyl carrier protein